MLSVSCRDLSITKAANCCDGDETPDYDEVAVLK